MFQATLDAPGRILTHTTSSGFTSSTDEWVARAVLGPENQTIVIGSGREN